MVVTKRYLPFLSAGLLFLLIGLMLGGCDRQNRPRANPLDPFNPTTGGKPQGLQAVAAHEKIVLTWPALTLDALTGYRLYRSAPGVADTTIEILSVPLSHTYKDSGVVDGRTYTYRLSAQIQSGLNADLIETPLSEPVDATPGPEFCWVIDNNLGKIVTLSADARSVSRDVVSIFGANHLAVDPSDGACWTTTRFGGSELGPVTVRFSAQGTRQATVTGFTFPASVAVDTRNGSVWVADTGGLIGGESSVSLLTPAGVRLFRLTGFTDPEGLAVDPNTGDCWVADTGAGRIVKIAPNGVIQVTVTAFSQPSEVAVDPMSGDCWGIDAATRRIFHLQPDGTLVATISGFLRPYKIACGAFDGSLWVTDVDASQVYQLNRNSPNGYHIGQQSAFHTVLSGFDTPLAITTDPLSGNLWISDVGRGEITKVTSAGVIIHRSQLLARPIALSVDPGPR